MPFDITRQPVKSVVTVCIYLRLSTALFYLPWWIVSSFPRSRRPRPSWTLKRCLMIKIMIFAQKVIGKKTNIINNTPDHRALRLGEGVEGVYVDEVPELITGNVKEWAKKADVQSIRLPGYWMTKKGAQITTGQKPSPGEKMLYFLHGGAYVMLSAHPSAFTSKIPRAIMEHCPSITRTFSIEYRLASIAPRPPAGSFPAALLDAIAGYAYLVDTVGFPPANIVVAGDSAGGNLAQALTRYLVEHAGHSGVAGANSETPRALPAPPGGLILISPWTDMSGSHTAPDSSMFTNSRSDCIVGPSAPYKVDPPRAFIAPHGLDFTAETPYISPACKTLEGVHFKGFPKTFVTAGDAELLLDQIRTLQGRMKNDMEPDEVVYYEAKDSVHDYVVFPWHEPERSETLDAISSWVQSL